MRAVDQPGTFRQHLIDPETCIRCNTCESRCPSKAISHATNYVVDPERCNSCMKCVRPCPTGAVDHWVVVEQSYSVEDQLGWTKLPTVTPLEQSSPGAFGAEAAPLPQKTHLLRENAPGAPPSASVPRVNLFTKNNPARAIVTGNLRITKEGSASDVHHIILDFGTVRFPYLEGQSVGVVPPGVDPDGRPHAMRIYSIASARDGERPNTNNLGLAVKRIVEIDDSGTETRGVASNWLCDLELGLEINVIGPFGSTFLAPDDPATDLLMICTGTGASPFRGFSHRRRRVAPNASGRMILFYGARTADELPFFGPLQAWTQSELQRELVYSRVGGSEKEYVQDRLRRCSADIGELLRRPTTHIYVCGLRGLEEGVDAALTDIARDHGLDWTELRADLSRKGQFHVEVY